MSYETPNYGLPFENNLTSPYSKEQKAKVTNNESTEDEQLLTREQWEAIAQAEKDGVVTGVTAPYMTVNQARVLQNVALPTEDEVYQDGLMKRAENLASKALRQSIEVSESVLETRKKSEELTRTKVELVRLFKELNIDDLPAINFAEFIMEECEGTQSDKEALISLIYDFAKASDNLKYSGTDLLETYTYLNSAFEISNKRPAPVTITTDELKTLADAIAPKKGHPSDAEQVYRKLYNRSLNPYHTARGRSFEREIEFLMVKYTAYYEGDIELETN